MTLRTITFDDSIYKLVPLEPDEAMSQAYYSSQRKNGFWNCYPVYIDLIAAAPEYQDTCTDGGKCGAGGYCKDCIQDTKKDE